MADQGKQDPSFFVFTAIHEHASLKDNIIVNLSNKDNRGGILNFVSHNLLFLYPFHFEEISCGFCESLVCGTIQTLPCATLTSALAFTALFLCPLP